MRVESRKHRRVELNYTARILGLDGEAICDCALVDISQGGARIAVLTSEIVPDEFLLSLSRNSNVSRRCKVVWRKDEDIGVNFLKTVDTTAATRAGNRPRVRGSQYL